MEDMSGNTEQCVLGLTLIHLTGVGGGRKSGALMNGAGISQNWEFVQVMDCGLKVFRSSLQISFIFF